MLHDMSRRRFVATAFGGVAALALPKLALGCELETLALKSRYTGKREFGDARKVSLIISWRDAAHGRGVLWLDPNITDGISSTCIAIQEVPVEVTQLLETQPVHNAKRYYELRERGEEGKLKAGKECWQLEQSLGKKPTYVLKAIDKDGKAWATIELFP